MKILVIDDESEVVSFLKDYFQENGHTVEIAMNGKAGLSLLESFQPDLIFSDHNMPELSGLELAQHIKENQLPCKIIIMSGYPNITEFFAKTIGAAEFLQKPFRFEDLDELVSKYAV